MARSLVLSPALKGAARRVAAGRTTGRASWPQVPRAQALAGAGSGGMPANRGSFSRGRIAAVRTAAQPPNGRTLYVAAGLQVLPSRAPAWPPQAEVVS